MMQHARKTQRRAWLDRWTPYGLYSGLKKALTGCTTVLDVGCGSGSVMHTLAHNRILVELDRHWPSLIQNRAGGIGTAHVLGDILALPVADRSFDAVTAIDVIEHLNREDGEKVLRAMERIARKVVVVYTPNGFVPQKGDQNPWQLHRSGWSVADLKDQGYRVAGIYGWKRLRGEYAKLLRRPRLLWEMVSWASHPMTSRHPKSAYALLAIKVIRK